MHQVFTPDGEFDRENCPYESYREMEFAPALPAARMAYFHRHFLGAPRPPPSEDVGLTAIDYSNTLADRSNRTGKYLPCSLPILQG